MQEKLIKQIEALALKALNDGLTNGDIQYVLQRASHTISNIDYARRKYKEITMEGGLPSDSLAKECQF